MDKNAEARARATARSHLIGAKYNVRQALQELYDHSPAYAGEVESVQDAIDIAIKVLNGEPPE